MNEPTTKSGRRLLDNLTVGEDRNFTPGYIEGRDVALNRVRTALPAIEAEAREQMTYPKVERRGFLRGRATVLSEIRRQVVELGHGPNPTRSRLIDPDELLAILDEMEKQK